MTRFIELCYLRGIMSYKFAVFMQYLYYRIKVRWNKEDSLIVANANMEGCNH